jgi:hypothetical protein
MKTSKNLSDARSGGALSFNLYFSLFLAAALLSATQVQTLSQTKQTNSTRSASGNTKTFTPQGAGSAVKGSGTAGMIPKWLDGSTLGDSIITEGSGNIGVGTTSPGSKLSVAGMIETTLGGYKFPDGTVQSTAGLASISHNFTLSGDGTTGSPLKIAVPLILSGSLASSSTLTVYNTGQPNGGAIFAFGTIGANGTNTTTSLAGSALSGLGGSSDSGDAGEGAGVHGGNSNSGHGGSGVFAIGGNSVSNVGGVGLAGLAGDSTSSLGGTGVSGVGGKSSSGDGGLGVAATGGQGNGSGHSGGDGITAFGGQGLNGAANGRAGSFYGDVLIAGNLTKNGGSFKIDHPLDPENKYLYHSFVESPDMMNIYNGNVTTDANGDAVITLPEWFEALNKDFRYQLTVIGTFAQAIVASEVKQNRFAIKSNAPNVKVSWQVTGIRQDAWANKHRIPTEENKSDKERGFYLHPELFNQPAEKSVEWALHPEAMRQVKQTGEQTKQKAQTNNQ